MTDSAPPAINSTEYWDGRFRTDWDAYSGREQTRFFARVALQQLPAWLVREVRRGGLSICDWGCAEGDAVDVLACHLGVPVTGVDFSEAAIEKARAYYPDHAFLCRDFLSGAADESFDVMFSSNTVEHFARPWDVFDDIAARARRFVVLLVPFREYERHAEHFYTFDYSNVPVHRAGFELVNATVVDTGAMTPNYWPGHQLLLVYARSPLVPELALTLDEAARDGTRHADVEASLRIAERARDGAGQQLDELRVLEAVTRGERDTALDELQRGRAELEALRTADAARADAMAVLQDERATLERTVAELREGMQRAGERGDALAAQLQQLQAQHVALDGRSQEREALLRQVLDSNSWRLTRPLRALRRWLG